MPNTPIYTVGDVNGQAINLTGGVATLLATAPAFTAPYETVTVDIDGYCILSPEAAAVGGLLRVCRDAVDGVQVGADWPIVGDAPMNAVPIEIHVTDTPPDTGGRLYCLVAIQNGGAGAGTAVNPVVIVRAH